LTFDHIKALYLTKNRPFIHLLSCESVKLGELSEAGPSFAEVLQERGAIAVKAYKNKVDARIAISDEKRFCECIKSGKSDLDAIRDSYHKSATMWNLWVELRGGIIFGNTPCA
jgi:hypothetical protein